MNKQIWSYGDVKSFLTLVHHHHRSTTDTTPSTVTAATTTTAISHISEGLNLFLYTDNFSKEVGEMQKL